MHFQFYSSPVGDNSQKDSKQTKTQESQLIGRRAPLLCVSFPHSDTTLFMYDSEVHRMLDAAAARLNARDFVGAAPVVAAALLRDPHNVRGLCLEAVVAAESGQKQAALDAISRAMSIAPNMPAVLNNAAAVYFRCGEPERAAEMWRRLLHIEPQSVEASFNLALYWLQQGVPDEAESLFRKVMQLAPNHPYVYSNLGNIIKDAGRIEEAIAVFREGVRRHPFNLSAWNNLLYALYFDPRFGSGEILREHTSWGRQFEGQVVPGGPFANDPSPNRRLRIGYLSPNFKDHCQAFFMVPLLSHHDRARFEICCYSDTLAPDDVTIRLLACTDRWRETRSMSDDALAASIRDDQIDILVDLTMHMAGSRLGVFARKAAPLQVTWLAYPGATGLSRMDYRITDSVLDPSGETDGFYSERSVRLETFWCYDPLASSPPVGPLPADAKGCVTFGSLNSFGKVNVHVLETWRLILTAVPESRLILLAPPGNSVDRVVHALGIEPNRVDCLPRRPRSRYLELYNQIDIALDPFPYSGHTTSLDSLWMGVPVVTLSGETAVSRGSLSILKNLGLQEMVTQTREDYVTKAIRLASDISELRYLREHLRTRMEQSPLMHAARFATNLEAAYTRMWNTWCNEKK